MQRFGEALALDPGNSTARLARANIYLNRGDYAAVDKDLDMILKAAPQDFRANYLRALEYVKKQDFAAADKILDRLSPAFCKSAGRILCPGPDQIPAEAIWPGREAIAKYVARVPNNPAGARLAATIALSSGNRNGAIDYLTSYLRNSPPDAATLVLLGKIYAETGKPALALEQFQKAAALAPNDVPLQAMVAASKIDAGARQEGIEQLENLFATQGGEAAAGPPLVLSELRAGHVDKAAEVAEKLVAEKPDLDAYQVLLGMVRTAQKDYPAAEKIFEGIVKRNPDSAPARNNLAQVYVAAGRVEDAQEDLSGFPFPQGGRSLGAARARGSRGAREEMGRGDRVCREGTRRGPKGSGARHQADGPLWRTPGLGAREGARQRTGDAFPG